jgi:hypothetical protein
MNPRVQIIAVLGSLGIMLLVFSLIRRRRLREEYAFIWFAASMGLIALSLWRDSLDMLAALAGVAYPPSVLLLGGIVVGFLLALHYALSLSRLAEQNKRLTQELALLQHEHTCPRCRAQSVVGASQVTETPAPTSDTITRQ